MGGQKLRISQEACAALQLSLEAFATTYFELLYEVPSFQVDVEI